MSTPDQECLFDLPPVAGHYPEAPGSKEKGAASEAAAKAIAETANRLRAFVLTEFVHAGDVGMTADECAAVLGRDVLSIRPRCSELVKAGKIIKTPTRRATVRGHDRECHEVEHQRTRAS